MPMNSGLVIISSSDRSLIFCCMQHLKEASKKEKLAKELETASSQEQLKLKQLQDAQHQLDAKGMYAPVHCKICPSDRIACLGLVICWLYTLLVYTFICKLCRSLCDASNFLLSVGSQVSVADILAIAGDTLGDLLDMQQGHTVTDKDIFRSSAQSIFAKQQHQFETNHSNNEHITLTIACMICWLSSLYCCILFSHAVLMSC